MLSLFEIKKLLTPDKTSEPVDDFRIIQSWAEYEEDSDKSPAHRNLKYLCYELEVMNPYTGERKHFYKAIKFARVIRLPANAKQSTVFMDMQQQILAGVYECDYDFITVIANIIKPTPIGLLYLYGVQGVDVDLDLAKEKAHHDFLGLISMLQGTFRVLEMKCIEAQETEWLREKMYNMDYMTVVRGIPKANKAGEDAGNKGIGNRNVNPDSEGTLEEIISGLASYEYVMEILSTPVYMDTLRGWQRKSQEEMSLWYGQLQGQKSLSLSLSIPMMYMANASQSSGWSKGHSDANTVSYSEGESFSRSQGQSLGQSLSQSYGTTIGHTKGASLSNSISNGLTSSESVSYGRGHNVGIGQSHTVGTSENIGTSHSLNANHSVSTNHGLSQGTTLGQSQGFSKGASYNVTSGQTEGLSHNVGRNESFGSSQSQSASRNFNATVGHNTSKSTSINSNHTSGYNEGGSYTHGSGSSDGNSANFSLSIKPEGIGFSGGGGVNHSTNRSNSWTDSTGFSRSDSVGASRSVSEGMSTSQSQGIGFTQSAGKTHSIGSSESYGTSSSRSLSEGFGVNQSQNSSLSLSNNIGASYGQGVSDGLGESFGVTRSRGINESFGASYNEGFSENFSQSRGLSRSQTLGQTVGQSVSESASQSATSGFSQNIGRTEGVSSGNTYSTSNGTSQGISTGTTGASTIGTSSSMGLGPSIGYNKSYQWMNQGVKDLLELMEYQNNRIKKALRGEGAFYTYVYIGCPSADALSAAQAAAKSTWQNEYAMVNPLQVLDISETEQKHLLYHFAAFSADVTREDVYGVEEYKYCTVLLPEEYVAYTHLPRVSEGGVFSIIQDIPKFSVPSMLSGEIYMGTVLNPERFDFRKGYRTPYDYRIDESCLMHGYITGASRSGKTVAAMRFIAELSNIRRSKTGKRLRIVAMDPKQDWRTLARFVDPDRFRFYSLGNKNFHSIKINPWKIPSGVWPQIWIDGVIDIYCRAYGLLERGKQMIADVVYELYEENGVMDACELENWKEEVSKRSAAVNFASIYKKMEDKRDEMASQGRSGNDTKDAYARLLERLSCFSRSYSIEHSLYGTSEGMGIDELIGGDDVTVLESKGLENTFKNFIFGVITSGFYKFAIAHDGGYLADDQYETVLVIEEANEILTGNDAASSGGGNNISLPGQSEFEQMLDQAAGYGLFIFAITQKIADMPSSIIANSGIVFAGKLKRPDDINVVVRAVGREERMDDRDLVKWFPRAPIGYFVCQTSRSFDFKDAEPILVQIARLNINPPSNIELDEILLQKEIRKRVA